MNKLRIAVFVSGSGTNLQSIIDHCENQKIDAEVIAVVSNKSTAYALERAKRHNIPTIVVESKKFIPPKSSRISLQSSACYERITESP